MQPIRQTFVQLAGKLGNRTVLAGMASKVWPAIAGLGTVVLITSKFSADQQGYYLTFLNLVGMSVFFELGLSGVIVQFVSHEMARLRVGPFGQLEGDAKAISRILSVARFAFYWFAVAAALMTVLLTVGGLFFFSLRPSHGINWAGPWLLLAIAASLDLLQNAAQVLLQGCDFFGGVYAYRLVRSVASTLTLWIAILLGAALWSAGLALVVSVLVGIAFLWLRYRGLLRFMTRPPSDERVDWRREMLPMQWRIAVSWMSGYVIASIFTPLTFAFQGAAAAGQIGLILSISNMIIAIAYTWVESAQARYGVLIASRRWIDLDRDALRSGLFAVGTAIAGVICVMLILTVLPSIAPHMARRFPPPALAALFLLVTVVNAAIWSMATYLRAYKAEPMLLPSVGCAILSAAALPWAVQHYGIAGMGVAYLFITGACALPAALFVLVRFRRRKQNATAPSAIANL